MVLAAWNVHLLDLCMAGSFCHAVCSLGAIFMLIFPPKWASGVTFHDVIFHPKIFSVLCLQCTVCLSMRAGDGWTLLSCDSKA